MGSHPDEVRRRLVPDEVQLQVILGSLLGGAVIEGSCGARSLRVSQPVQRERYLWWKYERLLAFASDAPSRDLFGVTFRTIAHPLFDDLARRHARTHLVRRRLAPLGLAVWMTDRGRVELRMDLFVPVQRSLAMSA